MNYNTILKSVTKPGRYTGGEFGQTIKDKSEIDVRFAFCFPDTYEIGMSNLGMRILYGVLNNMPNVWCERAFAPWGDMEDAMRKNDIKLCALESGDCLSKFDIIGFTLQYELCYTNVLNMLNLADIPLLSSDRGDDMPLIIGGGPCAYNSEPVADFFDIILVGEGEEALPEFIELYSKMRNCGKQELLHSAAKLSGFYVPSLYEVQYNDNGTIKQYIPLYDDIPVRIKKRIVNDLDRMYFPDKFVMPYIETIHDRIVTEVYRGCIRGCRFCQAGMIYRPVREKSPEVISEQSKTLYKNTGYDEISLCSLSISDYSGLRELTDLLLSWTEKLKVGLSLPSLRADSFSAELAEKISSVRMSGLTFAAEAGSQRLRDVINKNITEENILNACSAAFESGKDQVKLYFMLGLPTETYSDIDKIPQLIKNIISSYYNNANKKRPPLITVSSSCFIPKPFTPFQWESQDSIETIVEKQKYLGEKLKDKRIRYSWHDSKISQIEGVFARGNRLLSKSLIYANKIGIKFDSWDECFDYNKWMNVFNETNIDINYYTTRKISDDEILPWDIIDCGVSKKFLLSERDKAYRGEITQNCSEQCSGCGANQIGGNNKWCPKI